MLRDIWTFHCPAPQFEFWAVCQVGGIGRAKAGAIELDFENRLFFVRDTAKDGE